MVYIMINLRDYQKEVYDKIKLAFREGHKGVCAVLPCRSGKSYIMASIAENASKKNTNVLILAHRNSLLEQHRDLFFSFNINKNVRIESVFTEVNHLGENGKVDLIIIDEAHLSGASSYQKVCDYYNCRRILFTATPARLDGKPLNLADILIQGPTIKELIREGNISDFDYFAPDLQLNLENVKLVGGEYKNDQLGEIMNKPTIYGDVLKYYKMLGNNMQAIAYCVNIKHSKKICELFNSNKISSVHMDATTPEKERLKILEDFKNGKVQVLCNCNLISEGITLPSASVGLLLRPTMSLPLYIQQACRVLTPNEGKKAIIIDYVNNVETHGLPDEEREWTLKGKVSKRSIFNEEGNLKIKSCQNCYKIFLGSLSACPYCGWVNESNRKEIQEKKNIELKKITEIEAAKMKEEQKKKRQEVGMTKDFSGLVQLAKERGYKNPAFWASKVMQYRRNKNNGKTRN